MKFFHRLSIVIYISFITLSYYAYANYQLDYNFKAVQNANPSNICSKNNGTLDGSIDSGTSTYTFVDGFKYVLSRTWYQDSTINSENLPYILESGIVTSNVNLVHSFIDNNDGTFKLGVKSFNCQCPFGNTKYGDCQEEQTNIVQFEEYTNPLRVCSNARSPQDSVMPNIGYTEKDMNKSSSYSYGGAMTKDAAYKIWNRESNDMSQLNYTYKWYNGVVFITQKEEGPQVDLPGHTGFKLKGEYYECNCPTNSVRNSLTKLCEPVSCTPPEIEVSAGVCEAPDICKDGGQSLLGSCDRDCSEIGQYTINWDHDNNWNTQSIKRCYSTPDCNDVANECISQCGSIDNVLSSPLCNSTTGVSGSCQCKDDNLDDNIVDPEDVDENTPTDEVSNSLLKQIKDEEQKQTQDIQEISSLLLTANERHVERNDTLNSMDGKLSNIDGSLGEMNNNISNMNDNISNLNDNVSLGLDEANAHLTNIENSNDEIKDSNQGILDKITEFIDSLLDEGAIGNKISSLDMEGKTQGYMDSAFSQFGDVLGISQSYGSSPQNITVQLFNKTYTIVDFSVLSPYIQVIRNLFLSVAYILGFLFLLRKD